MKQTPTVVVINALLSVGVLILSSTLAVLHLASEVRLWDQPRQEGAEFSIQTHVLVLLLLTVGLLVSFNWFIGAYREKQELDTDEGEDENTGRSERRSDPAGQGLAEHRDERLVKKTR